MSSVSSSPCFCVLRANYFALHGLVWVRARKSSPCALNTPQIRHYCACWASFSHQPAAPKPCRRRGALQARYDGVFCAMRSAASACRRRVAPLHGAIPPDWRQRGQGLRGCGRQSADPLGEKRRKRPILAEWVCVLADSASGMVWYSHASDATAPPKRCRT